MNTPASTDKDLWVSWDEYNRLVERLALQGPRVGLEVRHGDVPRARRHAPGRRHFPHLRRAAGDPVDQFLPRGSRHEAGQPGHRQVHDDDQGPLAGKILLVDDLADSGVTLQKVHEHLTEHYADVTEVRIGRHLGQGHVRVQAGLPPGIPAAQSVDPPALRGLRWLAAAPVVGVDEEVRKELIDAGRTKRRLPRRLFCVQMRHRFTFLAA